MRSLIKLFALSCIASFFIASNAVAATIVGIASGQPGSLGHNTGQAVAKLANQEAKIIARTQPLAGTSAYVPLIDRGELDFGFVNGVELEYAFSGTGNWEGRANPDLRIVGVMFPLITGLMAPAKMDIKTIADLQPKTGSMRIASAYTADTTIRYYIMGALANGGLTYDDFKKIPVSNLVKGMEALGDGLLDIALVSYNSGAGKKANATLSGGLQYISLDTSEAGVQGLKKYMPVASIITMKADPNVPGMQEDKNLIKIPWVMITSKNAPDELVYKMVKVIAENNAKLSETFSAFKRASIEEMAPATIVPYHPGALKYYEEKGIPVGK